MEGTLGEREEGCQGHYCPSAPGLLMQPLPTYEKALDQQCGEWSKHLPFALENTSTVTNDVNQTC